MLKSKLKELSIIDDYLNIIKDSSSNFKCYDKDDYLYIVLDSDILIGECSSLMPEFSITNNSIFYIGDYNNLF